jgi:hypothetical protein
MPSENSNRDEKYKDTMAQLEEIIDKFVEANVPVHIKHHIILRSA